jgi:hypothetical protein
MQQNKIAIIGAGLTGLIAAKELKAKGKEVVLLEKLNQPGGRVRSVEVAGWKLDVGFQVLLTAYPHLNKHVPLHRLELQYLDAGATIFHKNSATAIGDPTRTKGVLLSTIFSNIGSVKDKLLIFKLQRTVKKWSLEHIFQYPNGTTIEYLRQYGFSDNIIQKFFRPFFTGIFLEDQLETSVRMFLFVFKMFAEGNAAIPKEGMSALPEFLVKEHSLNVMYNTDVTQIGEGYVLTANGEKIEADLIVDTRPLVNELPQDLTWNGCQNLYFEHPSPRRIKSARIGLNANPKSLVNNIFYPSSISVPSSKQGMELLSVTVVNSQRLGKSELARRVVAELEDQFQIKELKEVHAFFIPIGVPSLKSPKDDFVIVEEHGVIKAGDYAMNGSQNAACKAGELIASFILDKEQVVLKEANK